MKKLFSILLFLILPLFAFSLSAQQTSASSICTGTAKIPYQFQNWTCVNGGECGHISSYSTLYTNAKCAWGYYGRSYQTCEGQARVVRTECPGGTGTSCGFVNSTAFSYPHSQSGCIVKYIPNPSPTPRPAPNQCLAHGDMCLTRFLGQESGYRLAPYNCRQASKLCYNPRTRVSESFFSTLSNLFAFR